MSSLTTGVEATLFTWEVKDVSKERSWHSRGELTSDQVVDVSIIGVVMILALIEWFLYLAAFCYCFHKVIQKAENWHTRLLAVVMIFLFVALRFGCRAPRP